MAGPQVVVKFLADTTKLAAAADEVESSAGSKLKSFGTKAAVAIGGAFAVSKVVDFGKASVDAATESAVANARLEQVMRSMGDTTGDAAAAAEDYASSLSKRIGVDDEAILAGQAQLATFGEVSSESARMAGIFDRATAAGADLAAAGFGSIESNAVQLGKALQDPTKGMTALAKSGVTFTDAQKDQIKALQDSGQLLEAQKIVLAAVEQQVGGTAEATVTSQQKAALAFGELQEQLGSKLLPIVSFLADVFTKYGNVLLPIAGIIAAIVAVTSIWTAVQTAFNVIMAMNPIVLVVLAIAALVAAVILAYQKVDWFRAFVDSAFAAVVAAFNWLKDAAAAVFNWISNNWPLLLAILLGPFGVAVGLIVKNWDTIKEGAVAAFNWVRDNWPTLLAIITGPIGIAVLLISRNWDTIKDGARAVLDFIRGIFDSIAGVISGAVGGIASAISSVVNAIKGPINAVISAWNGLEFRVPSITVPSLDLGPLGKVGGQSFGGFTIGFPDLPRLASGGVLTAPTLFIGGEAGTEIVSPEDLLRAIVREEGGRGSYTLNLYPRTADAADVAYGFRRLELLAGLP